MFVVFCAFKMTNLKKFLLFIIYVAIWVLITFLGYKFDSNKRIIHTYKIAHLLMAGVAILFLFAVLLVSQLDKYINSQNQKLQTQFITKPLLDNLKESVIIFSE